MFVPFVNLQFIPRNLELSLIDYYLESEKIPSWNLERYLPGRESFFLEFQRDSYSESGEFLLRIMERFYCRNLEKKSAHNLVRCLPRICGDCQSRICKDSSWEFVEILSRNLWRFNKFGNIYSESGDISPQNTHDRILLRICRDYSEFGEISSQNL